MVIEQQVNTNTNSRSSSSGPSALGGQFHGNEARKPRQDQQLWDPEKPSELLDGKLGVELFCVSFPVAVMKHSDKSNSRSWLYFSSQFKATAHPGGEVRQQEPEAAAHTHPHPGSRG